ncbi:MAG: hypothetical protein GY757_01135, partial [bacterium]|nr:hypothetical protein [bacterium]
MTTMGETIRFSTSGYRELLEIALHSGYRFLAFHDQERFEDGRYCLLRHDVEANPGAALNLAKTEHRLGIRSTYFFMLRSPLYNLMSRCNHRTVQEILELGHWLGLHFDGGFLPDERRLEELVDIETGILHRLFDVEIKTVSFHQPCRKVLSGEW